MTRPVYYSDNKVYIIDQTQLPGKLCEMEITSLEEMWDAIRTMKVRGAPAIGVACAFGIYLGIRNTAVPDGAAFKQAINYSCDRMSSARPTAVNLFKSAERMREFAAQHYYTNIKDAVKAVLQEAQAISDEDALACRSIGLYGADLLSGCHGILTHCNAGALATTELGTATAPMYILHERGHRFKVYADETRPLLQGSRLTAWELSAAGLDVTVITDSMAGVIMRDGWVDAVIVGSDRIARNGDMANKIGTYSLSVLAKAHNIPFYVAAPFTTVDFDTDAGALIPIEQRPAEEVRFFEGRQIAPAEARIFNPCFDVTPAQNIAAFITERGIAKNAEELRKLNEFGRLRYE